MKPGAKAGLISFIIIVILFAVSYYYSLYTLSAVFNIFPLFVPPFLGVMLTIRHVPQNTFSERFKGGIQASLVAGLLFAATTFFLLKSGFIKHELIDPNNLVLNIGMTINIFAFSGAILSALFSVLLYKKQTDNP